MDIHDKARAAQRLKENADYQLIMAEIEADIFASFRNTAIGSTDELNQVHMLSHGFKLIANRIDKYVQIAQFEAAKNEEY
jgi:hypothetical protein